MNRQNLVDPAYHGRRTHQRRAGTTFVELAVASVLIGSLAVVLLPTIKWVDWESHAARQRQVAAEELSNLLDRITSRGWQGMTNATVDSHQLAESLAVRLVDPRLDVAVKTVDDAKQITLTLTWKSRSGVNVAPVMITTWVYPPVPNAR